MATVDESQVAFLDLETTGLDPIKHEIWEIGLIVDSNEYEWQLPVRVGGADSAALRINRFYERVKPLSEVSHNGMEAAFLIAKLTAGRHIVGAVPSFDVGFLEPWLRSYNYCPAWSHRLICVETLAAGAYQIMPCGLSKIAERAGIDIETGQAHTALGDARTARAVFRAIYSHD